MAIKIHFQFDVPVVSGAARWLIAGALVIGVPLELGSETVTLTTYYPAPSGVYIRMITTDNTFLARDGGRLGVGTTGPGSRVSVNGNAAIGAAYATLAAPANGLVVQGSVGIGNAAPTAGNALHVTGVTQVDGATRLNGASRFDGVMDAQGNLRMTGFTPTAGRRGYIYISNAQTECGGYIIITANSSGFCGGGYVTFTPGLYVEGWTYQNMSPLDLSAITIPTVPNLNVNGYCCPK